MLAPVIEDGCVVVEGDRIVEVGPTSTIKPPRVDEEIDGVLMPGLINAHTHLELTNVPRPQKPGTFQDWLLTTMASMREADPAVFAAKRAAAVREGIAQCLKFGVTCIGDISQNVDVVRPILRDGPIRSVSFGEVLGLGERRSRFHELLAKAVDDSAFSDLMQIGVSPHAPYTVDVAGYHEVTDYAHFGVPLTTHLAETLDEKPFISSRTGPFRSLYERLNFDAGEPDNKLDGGPIEMLMLDAGAMFDGWLLAHVNYCDDEELTLIAKSVASVVWCPRTHAYFGHPPHRWTDMLDAGINVCVGTDSCASSPDLNLVDDLRLIHRNRPQVGVDLLWSLCTTRAAAALRWPGRLAALEPGAYADLIAFATTSRDPLREVLEAAAMLPSAVCIGGVHQTP